MGLFENLLMGSYSGSMQPGQAPVRPAHMPEYTPQAQQVSGGDQFWEAFRGAAPGVADSLDMASQLGMVQGPMVKNSAVPGGQPNIGPGIYGLSALVNASNQGGFGR